MTTSTLTLVSCVARKAAAPCAARDLYGSIWFRAARAYAESRGGPWAILSARHGLLRPDAVVAPYDLTLRDLGPSARVAWATDVAATIRATHPATRTITLLAGRLYRDPLVPLLDGYTVESPLAHLGIGQQVAWLQRQVTPRWAPIASAPRDGRAVLLYLPRRPAQWAVVIGAWASGQGGWQAMGSLALLTGAEAPSHWMPLPAPPPLDAAVTGGIIRNEGR